VNRQASEGLALGIASALIGGGWQVATRLGATGDFAVTDIALLRYGVPALVLLPLLLRGPGLAPVNLRWRPLACLVIGAGLPFGLLAVGGSSLAPAAHMGVLMAGAMPLMAALLSWRFFGERPNRMRCIGLAAMTLGVALLGFGAFAQPRSGVWRGDILFLLAAALWAAYTLCFRRCGLTPWQGAAIVNAWSLLLLAPIVAWRGVTLFDAPQGALLTQLLWQGVLAGLLGLWTINACIARLGDARAAAFGALVPVVSAIGGVIWLDDALGATEMAAIALAAVGVWLASRGRA
jgi:drug/metabolite transporter (DMT)-like permease